MYAMQVNLTGKHVVIIGGGRVAYRKVQQLLKEDMHAITIISKTFLPEFFAITHANLKLITKCYDANDIKNANLIIAATDDKEVNNQVAKDAHIDQWVNNVSDKEQSDFYNVSQFTVDNVTVQIISEGKDYHKVKTLTTEIKEYLNCSDEEDKND
ncbi:NAD(P)-dependent oxidoreductase [Staphylococcus gallinarum]|jgi:precorrin-2 dehydrogenase/sirohydrochlorin ferrochelatase|uniref:precorrin-2 dehydrogenase n=1 Tax=Staphylococcus gallinarum TaxID=1293 RepID=A0A2T4T0S6_STAGA|nr:NAD(P)-dependent oxidoreductase [Staphylococcus gallinarum]MCD8821408.1 NAD(P)-dependent oxidoreductase [Staphylococcus gallinarum]MCD8826927.1 NAD(P)-dependent oxidoreductase [Staphylococcus gallinarum]PTE79563.1 preprotein translocase subunit TatB [Staphylococcus gallinarum]PTL08149.1 preprotein translocase subunit TatB [Staphylococcus gallinarum]PTL11756.1 preprotein translocase subunit TatB [Staphylococcus gallinarum]